MANPTSRGSGKSEGVQRVPVLALGQSTAATVLTRFRGQLRLTVIAKASFAFAPQAEMTPAPPVAICAREVHHGENPAKSIRATSDLAPHVERAQAIFVGTAHTGGAPQRRLDVRFAIGTVHGVLLDKRLEVVGDRRAATPNAEPAPFTQMPLVYERAFGGIGFAENPLGPGVDASATMLPNVLFCEAGRAREPASFAPISASWPARKRLLKSVARKQLEARLVELPDDFTFDYFQSTPQDQQIRALDGREWIVLEGLNARHPMLHMRLPWARAAAIVYGPGVPYRPFELTADTLYVDGDTERCSIIYRASIPLAGDHLIADLAVAAGVETTGRPLAWPVHLDADELRAVAGPQSSRRGADVVSSTLSVEDFGATRSSHEMPPPERVLPFVSNPGQAPKPKTGEIPIPGAPWAGAAAKAARAPIASSPFAGTVALDERPAGIDFDAPPVPPPPRSKPKDPWLPPAPEASAPAPRHTERPAIMPVPAEHK